MTTLSLENNYNDKDYKELFKQLDTDGSPSTIDKPLAKVSTENNDNLNTSNISKTKRKGKGKYKTRSNL
jgi:hypothetical protein